jgi:hypothetical protein
MRTRRQFRPTFDALTLRIAPSGGVAPDPMDPVCLDSPPPVVNPMDPGGSPAAPAPSPLPVVGPDGGGPVAPPAPALC